MRFLLVVAVLLAGCAGTKPIAKIEGECGVGAKPFGQAWPCVKTGLIGGRPADIVGQYEATGDVVAERVKAGQMTEAEARLTMAKALREANDTAIARYNGASSGGGGGPTVYQRVGPQTVIAY